MRKELVLILLFLLSACGGGSSSGDKESPTSANISINKNYYYLPPSDTTINIPVDKTGSGHVSWSSSFPDNEDWVSIEGSHTGEDTGVVTVIVSENNGKARSASLEILTDNTSTVISVEISQSPAVTRVPDYSETEAAIGWDFVYEDYLASLNTWNYQVVTAPDSPIRYGSSSERFELRPGDCNSSDCGRTPPYERAENVQINLQQYEGEEYWYSFSFYVPADYIDDGLSPDPGGACSCINFAQFHQSPNYDVAWMFSKSYGGSFLLRRFPTRGDIPYQTFALIDKDEFVGRWHDIIVNASWTTEANGFMNIWVNGRLMVEYDGFTRTIENNDVYFKYGLYRGSGPDSTVKVYMDEFARGDTRQDVDIRIKDG